jgi:hypothetical protein
MGHLDLNYATDWPSLPVVEHMLTRNNWQSPQTTLHQYKTNTSDLATAPWLQDERAKLPPEFELFPWNTLTTDERDAIQQKQAEENLYSPNLDPFIADSYLAFNGMGLRYQGEVIGWMVTHQSATDTIQYTSLFLLPQFQQQRLAIPLLAAALNRQIESDIPFSIWQVEAHNEAMLTFVRRYLQPYLAKESQRLLVRKLLTEGKAY